MYTELRSNLCPLAVMLITSEVSDFKIRQLDQDAKYNAQAQIETTSTIQARANPIALILKKSVGLETPFIKSISVSVSSEDTGGEASSLLTHERKMAAEAMFQFLSEQCLRCPLRNICPSREDIGRDARKIADTSQKL